MSTTFAIIIQNRMNNKIRIDIAHRSSAGGGKVNIKWLNDLAPYIDKNTIVHAVDNTNQGVQYMGDLFTLSKYGNFNEVYRYGGFNLVDDKGLENDKSIHDKIEKLQKEIKAVQNMFNEINEINYINNKTKRTR